MTADALAALLDMDGYALYVWGSFVMAAAAAAWEALMLAHRRRRALEELDELRRLQADGFGPDLADRPYTSAGHAP
jgi:heme exporter protein D